MNHTQTLIERLIENRAQEIIDLVSIGMTLEWAINYVRNSTTLSDASMQRVIEIVREQFTYEEG